MRQEQWYPDEQTHTAPGAGEGELKSFCLVCTQSVEVDAAANGEIALTSYLGATWHSEGRHER